MFIALIAAGSAILASIGAQIIGGIMAAKQETKRAERDHERYVLEAQAAERARFEDVKRKEFSEFLFYAHLARVSYENFTRPYMILFGQFKPLKYTREVMRRRYSIILIAPELAEPLEKLQKHVFDVDLPFFNAAWSQTYRELLIEILEGMRKSLGIDSFDGDSQGGPQLNEAPMRGRDELPES